jgi:hypothetical protein
MHEVPAERFVDERPALWVVENMLNRDLELLREALASILRAAFIALPDDLPRRLPDG